jgi:hypothetical protein
MSSSGRPAKQHEYDVCLSFAGEDREYVEAVAELLRDAGIRIFYDRDEQINLWGKDLYAHLDYIYQRAARYCILFISQSYASKVWTSHERQSAQARALNQADVEYVLPARFDDTVVPGLRDTIGYVDLRELSPSELASMVRVKVGRHVRYEYLPPKLDLLHERVGAKSSEDRHTAHVQADEFFLALKRMSDVERRVVLAVFHHGCGHDATIDTHLDVDLLRRLVEMPPSEILETLRGVRSLGFALNLKDDENGAQMVHLEWHLRRTKTGGNATKIGYEMIHLA